jgi:apolipoprotein N-acyltransferase
MMKAWRLQVLTTVSVVCAPLTAMAGKQMAAVTVAPVGTAAPAVGTAMLAFLTVVLAGGAFFILRRKSVTASGAMVVLAALTMVAVTGYAAAFTTVVMGEDCSKETTLGYPPDGDQTLESQCPNPIRIVAFELNCDEEVLAETVPDCEIGTVLEMGETCQLPTCDV